MSSNVRNPLLNYASNDEFYDALEEEFVKFQQEMSKKRLPMKFVILAMLRKGNFAQLVINDNGSESESESDSVLRFIPDYDKQEFSTSFINFIITCMKEMRKCCLTQSCLTIQ